ncbi:MAG: hypothetical protein J6Y94_04110, partial [Bacteriovoracaceae bacterium]|nr:hypothetical protein [Bacteriovoracaceae bacterium]
MENLNQNPQLSSKKLPPSIVMNFEERPQGNDEFSIDHLKFKAINPGLGFHQEVRGRDLKFQRPLRASGVMPPRQRTMIPPRSAANMASVALPRMKTHTQTNAHPSPSPATFKTPATSWQLTAWMIDVVSVLVCFMFTLGVFFVASGLNFAQFWGFMQRQDFQIFAVTLLAIYYIIYF